MKTTFTTALAVSALLALTAWVQADTIPATLGYNTPFDFTKSYDDNPAGHLYVVANEIFGTNISGNEALWDRYGVANPGTIQASEARVYGLRGHYGEDSAFAIFGETTSDLFYYTAQFGNAGDLSQFYNTQPLFNNPAYTGDLNFRISNTNGTFYSNIYDFDNYVNSTNPNRDALINHFVYFDVTSLMESAFPNLGFAYTTAYLVGYEDRKYGVGATDAWDGDYNDGMFLVFVNNNAGATVTPEPATLLILGLGGLIGLPFVTRKSRKNAAA